MEMPPRYWKGKGFFLIVGENRLSLPRFNIQSGNRYLKFDKKLYKS